MAAISSIDTRLRRLESKTDLDNPLAQLTDEELNERLTFLVRNMFDKMGNGDGEAGYSAFRQYCECETPDSLDTFISSYTEPNYLGLPRYDEAKKRLHDMVRESL